MSLQLNQTTIFLSKPPFIYRMRCILHLSLFLSALQIAHAQERCATVINEKIKNPYLLRQKEAQFEQWIKNKTLERLTKSNQRTQTGPYIIPVVVHVIHNGESIGTGTN